MRGAGIRAVVTLSGCTCRVAATIAAARVTAACAAAPATIAATGRCLRRGRAHHADWYIIRRYPCLADLDNFDRKLCIGGALCAGLIMRVCYAGNTINICLPRDACIGGALCAGSNTCVRYNSLTVKIGLTGGAGII